MERPRFHEHERRRITGLLLAGTPRDRISGRQDAMPIRKKAAALLESLDRAYPQHPGIPHYLIHAYDNAETRATRLSKAAKAYAENRPLCAARHCTCHRISSRGSAYGKTPSHPISQQGKQHTSRVTPEKSCTPWIILSTPICRAGREQRGSSDHSATQKTCRNLKHARLQDRLCLHRDADSLHG